MTPLAALILGVLKTFLATFLVKAGSSKKMHSPALLRYGRHACISKPGSTGMRYMCSPKYSNAMPSGIISVPLPMPESATG